MNQEEDIAWSRLDGQYESKPQHYERDPKKFLVVVGDPFIRHKFPSLTYFKRAELKCIARLKALGYIPDLTSSVLSANVYGAWKDMVYYQVSMQSLDDMFE